MIIVYPPARDVVPYVWRLMVLIVIEVIALLVVAAGYSPQAAIALAAGGGAAAAGVATRLLGSPIASGKRSATRRPR
jgi:hypothetical protein